MTEVQSDEILKITFISIFDKVAKCGQRIVETANVDSTNRRQLKKMTFEL